MKNNTIFYKRVRIFLFSGLVIMSTNLFAQVDTTKPAPTDSVKTVPVDTDVQAKTEKQAKNSKFIIYGGANINNLNVNSTDFDANGGVGYQVGFAYRRGNFFYWQAGARYNRAVYKLVSLKTGVDTSNFTVNAIDVPLTAGINFLSFMGRLVSVRAFVSAMPSFTIGVGDNDVNFTKDHVNSFIMYGQGGIGVDITFIVIEAGYNYGFSDLLKDRSNTNPGQFFVNVGFRF